MVGGALCQRLESLGHEVRRLSRSRGDFRWSVDAGTLDAAALDGVDCVVHLAGEPIAQRWSPAVKRSIRESRVRSTRLLVEHVLRQERPVDFICASGISYYGTHAGAGQCEDSPAGDGFLASVCKDWEAELQPLRAAGHRAVSLRIGVVLSPEGGALKKLLPPFRAGLGGRVGSGTQLMSWIALPDLVEIIRFAVEQAQLRGAVNAVAPEPVTNRAFTRVLGAVLKRPTILPVPAAAMALLFGEMALETVLSDVGVHPRALEAAGFKWQTPDLRQALECALQS